MIGLFDSGVGGLSVWRELYKVLPQEKYLYFSDAGHCPYGPKSKEEIILRAKTITEYLIGNGAEIIVVACNTATAASIEYLRGNYNIPFVGMEPAVKPAAINTRTGAIGVLATKGTFKGELYLRTLHKFASNAKVLEQVGEGLVELVENGEVETPKAKDGVEIVNPAPAIARRALQVLQERKRSSVQEFGQNTFVTTGDNMEVLEAMVGEIAPDDYKGFVFRKIEI